VSVTAQRRFLNAHAASVAVAFTHTAVTVVIAGCARLAARQPDEGRRLRQPRFADCFLADAVVLQAAYLLI